MAIDLAGVVPAAYDEVLAATGIADLDGQPGGKPPPTATALTSAVRGR